MNRDLRISLKKKSFFPLLVLTVLLLMGILPGCSDRVPMESILKDGEYLIYYLDASGSRLIPVKYEMQSETKEEQAEELMEQFLHVPKDLDCQSALSDKVAYQGSRLEDQVLYLYFDVNYTAMKAEQEILCRAALAKTMTQLDGVDYVNIYSADQPLIDRQGNPVGLVSSGDFILTIGNVNTYEKTELTLYFADKTGSRLEAEKREVVHNINTSMEQLVVEQLIAGPQEEGHMATLPSDCKILSISVKDNVCYINFDSSFLNTSLPVNEYLPIYSIVNSISEMTAVNRVQIMVNGSQNVMFRDVISLNTTFERSQESLNGSP